LRSSDATNGFPVRVRFPILLRLTGLVHSRGGVSVTFRCHPEIRALVSFANGTAPRSGLIHAPTVAPTRSDIGAVGQHDLTLAGFCNLYDHSSTQMEEARMSSGDLPEAVLERLDETRRAFINKMIAATPFLVPAVASLTITSFTADEVAAQTVVTTVMSTAKIPANSSVGLAAAAAALVVTGVALLQRRGSKQAGEETKE
jgi:hypothetical protein